MTLNKCGIVASLSGMA